MKKNVKSILARHTERVTSQMKDLFEIIETYRKIHGIDPLTGQIDHIKLEQLKKLGRTLQKGFSKNRKNKKIEMSSRVEDRCDKVLERLKKKIREINERPANAPIPSRRPIVSRPSVEKKKKEEEEEKKRNERKKRPRPTSIEGSKTEKKRARTVNEDEEKKEEEEDVMEIANDDVNEDQEDENTIALPKIVASGAALSTPTSITKKKKKTKKKKSVRFNLNLNTTHF
eukprot:g6359.t1